MKYRPQTACAGRLGAGAAFSDPEIYQALEERGVEYSSFSVQRQPMAANKYI